MNIRQFLEKHGLPAGNIDADGLIAEFFTEMEAGLAGRASSLAMIPSYITAEGELPPDKPVAVIDAGGTNLRVASVHFDAGGGAHIEAYSKYSMPGSRKEVSADAFFRELSGRLQHLLEKTDRIGFCFSYPAEITPDRDGRLIKWTKEMRAPEVIGRMIGRGLLDALGAAGTGKRIVLLNDTIATLLAGKSVAGGARYGAYIGFILGTGTNIAYPERNENILKVNGLDPSGSQAVNVESAGFSKIPRGDIDEVLDAGSGDPGSQQLEKMISGRYLPEIILLALQAGQREGLFGGACAAWIDGLKSLDHGMMDALATGGDLGPSARLSETDRQAAGDIVGAVIERAAKLAAVNITAAAVKAVGEGSRLPVCINIDGSTYYKAAGLREHTEKYLGDMLGARGISHTLVHVERAPIIGAAIAGIVN